MGDKTLPIYRSEKKIKDIGDFVSTKYYVLPEHYANEREPITMKRCVYVQRGEKRVYIPVNEKVMIEQDVFAILHDANIHPLVFIGNIDFDPLHPMDNRI